MNTHFLTALLEASDAAYKDGEMFDTLGFLTSYTAAHKDSMGHMDAWAMPVILQNTCATILQDGLAKDISIPDFYKILASAAALEETGEILSLPFGCFSFSRTAVGLSLLCYYPEVISRIGFQSNIGLIPYTVPMPNVVIHYKLKSVDKGIWQVQSVQYYATNKKLAQLPEDLMNKLASTDSVGYLSLSNMYEDNRMCYGGNSMPSRFTNNLKGLDYYYQIISIAPFNSDLGIRGLKSRMEPRDWYKLLSTKTEYPYELTTLRL